MVNFEGTDYIKIHVSGIELNDEADHRRMILFNIMSDASDIVEIDLFKKTPIASIIFSYEKDDSFYDSDLVMCKAMENGCREDLANLISAKTTGKYMTIGSRSAEYKYISESIPDTKLHNMLLVYDMSCKDYRVREMRNYVIAALPCRGIITPLKQSKGFKLFNGELVMTGPFDSELGYSCNRIVYIFAQIYSFISIEEYYYDPGDYVGLCTVHTIGGLTLIGMRNASSLEGYDYINETNYPFDSLIRHTLEHRTSHFIIPYDGNESLFMKTGGNIFSISTSSQSDMRKVRITS